MEFKSSRFILPTLCFSFATSFSAQAIDWRIGFGGHDIIVEQADSHTLGVNAKFSFVHYTESGILLSGDMNVFIDHDKDKLDPDHIPVWFDTEFLAKGALFKISDTSHINWEVELDGRRNTVNSVEKQFKLMPALSYEFRTDAFDFGVKAGAGGYFLEIDDDVPKTRGYDRSDYQNKTGAYTLAADTRIGLGSSFDLEGKAQHWNDGSDWLENKYSVNLNYHSDSWIEDSVFVISIEHTEYNLDHYAKVPLDDPDYLPILPWDNDTLVNAWDMAKMQTPHVNFTVPYRKNSPLKTLTFTGYKQYLAKHWRADTQEMINHQNGKSTELKWSDYAFKTGLSDSDFNRNSSKRER